MKKTILLLSIIFSTMLVSAQSVIIFDGTGASEVEYVNPWWGVEATVEVVGWLQKDGTNAADPNFGATIWRNNENPGYTGGGINLDLDISMYNKISVDISKRVSGNVQVELQDGETKKAWLNVYYDANGSGGYGTGTWQTLTFDIPDGWSHLTALLVAPHNVNTTENPINFVEDNERHRMSWDNVIAFNDTSTGISNPFSSAEIIKTEIFSMTGTLLKTLDGAQNIPYTLMLKGMYILKQTDAEGNITSSKISVK